MVNTKQNGGTRVAVDKNKLGDILKKVLDPKAEEVKKTVTPSTPVKSTTTPKITYVKGTPEAAEPPCLPRKKLMPSKTLASKKLGRNRKKCCIPKPTRIWSTRHMKPPKNWALPPGCCFAQLIGVTLPMTAARNTPTR